MLFNYAVWLLVLLASLGFAVLAVLALVDFGLSGLLGCLFWGALSVGCAVLALRRR